MHYEWHEYDIDAITLYNHIKTELDVRKITREPFNKEDYLSNIFELIKLYFGNKKITPINKPYQVLISSSHNLYSSFVSLSLAYYDTPKIKLFLDYQKNKFEGNYYAAKENFVGLIEFISYHSVKNWSPFDTEKERFQIAEWVREERKSEQVVVGRESNITPILENFYYWKHGKQKLIQAESSLLNPIKPYIIKNDSFIHSFQNVYVNKKHKTIWKGRIKESFAFLYLCNGQRHFIDKERIDIIANKLFTFKSNPSLKSLSQSYNDFSTRVATKTYIEKKFSDLISIVQNIGIDV